MAHLALTLPSPRGRGKNRALAALALSLVLLLTGCASPTVDEEHEPPPLTPTQARALIERALPASTTERDGWAIDIYAAFASMDLRVTPANVCAVVAVAEQESGVRVDPLVPNLAAITWKEIDRRAEQAGVPRLVVHAALALPSPNGKSYSSRIDAARTEGQLSHIFEDFIGIVPMGKTLFGSYNPVRTGGPMQVSVAYAEHHASDKPYPYDATQGLRHEVFTRRGGMYFGIAHLLDYPADYDQLIYRYADYNAGHYASRNAAFQNALSTVSGIPLDLDGDLIDPSADDEHPGATERAARVLARRLGLSEGAIHRALEQGEREDFAHTTLYERVFALADKLDGRALPRAVVPRIQLRSPKFTRKLTTEWFANRVEERHKRCMGRVGPSP